MPVRTITSLVMGTLILASIAAAQESQPASVPPPTSIPVVAQPLPAQPDPTPLAEGAHWIRVTADQVHLRTRSDLNSLPVARLARDTVLKAVGGEYGWHKVEPPPGVFVMVSADYVRREGGDRGVVAITGGTLNVRAGSSAYPITPENSEVLTRLQRGAAVQILGEENGWLKIVPPDDVYFYVSSEFTAPINEQAAHSLTGSGGAVDSNRPAEPPEATRIIEPAPAPAPSPSAGVPPLQRPAGSDEVAGVWGERLRRAERNIEAESRLSTLDQQWSIHLEALRPIATQTQDRTAAAVASGWMREIHDRIARVQAAKGHVAQAPAEPMPTPMTPLPTASSQPAAVDATLPPPASQPATPPVASSSPPVAAAPRPTHVPPPPPKDASGYAAIGVLRPCFTLPAGPHGLRYQLEDPFTRKPRGYAEFPFEYGVFASSGVNRFVGVMGSTKYDEASKKHIIQVESMTVLRDSPAENGSTAP